MICLMRRGSIGLCAATAMLLAPSGWSSTGSQHPNSPPPAGGLWTGGVGIWSSPSNWNVTGDWQLNSPTGALIDAGNPITSVVMVDVNVSTPGAVIDANDAIRILSGHGLKLLAPSQAPVITCAGSIVLEGYSATSRLTVGPDQALVLNGGGTVTLLTADRSVINGENAQSLLYNVNALIHGAGKIGDDSLGLVNGGVIRASVNERNLVVDPGPLGMTNAGELHATGGGRLLLQNGVIQNPGRLVAGDGSRIEIEGATVFGGELDADGDGFFRTSSTPSALHNVTCLAPYELGPTRLTLSGFLVNNNLFSVVPGQTLAPPGGDNDLETSELVIPPGTGDFTLNGDGTMRLHLCTVHSGSTAASGRLIHGPDHTIIGAGLLGANTVGLVNHGTIIADEYNSIAIDPPNPLMVENNGSMIAMGFGGISVTGATFVNNGMIEVRDASRFIITSNVTLVNNAAGTLNGGTWRVLAEGHPTTLGFWGGTQIFSNNADILLSGVGSFFAPINVLSDNLARLSLRNGRDFSTSAGFFTNTGTLDLGATCLFKVNGLYMQDAVGRLMIEVDGSAGEGLTAVGQAFLGGTLEIRLSPRASFGADATIEVLRAASVSGTFSQIIAPSGVDVQVGPTGVFVTVHKACPTDLNGDGAVGIQDLLTVVGAWGPCPPAPQFCPADFNGSHAVDMLDLLFVVSAWGVCSN